MQFSRPAPLGVGLDVALDEQRAPVGAQPGRQQHRRHRARPAPQHLRVLRHRDGVQVDDTEEILLLVLPLGPALHRAQVVAQRWKLPRRLYAAEHPLPLRLHRPVPTNLRLTHRSPPIPHPVVPAFPSVVPCALSPFPHSLPSFPRRREPIPGGVVPFFGGVIPLFPHLGGRGGWGLQRKKPRPPRDGASVVPPYFTTGAPRQPHLSRALAYDAHALGNGNGAQPVQPYSPAGLRTGGSQVHSVSASGAGSHLTRLS